jgi:hypothetical protein
MEVKTAAELTSQIQARPLRGESLSFVETLGQSIANIAPTHPYYSYCLDLLQYILSTRDYLARGAESDYLDGHEGYCNGTEPPK